MSVSAFTTVQIMRQLYRRYAFSRCLCGLRRLVGTMRLHSNTSANRLVFLTFRRGLIIPAVSLWSKADTAQNKRRSLLNRADFLYDDYQIDVVLKLLKDAYDPDDHEIVWRMARATCEMGKIAKDLNARKKQFADALELIKHAKTLPDSKNCSQVYKWYAIIMNYNLAFKGTKERIENSLEIKEHFLKAVELNPKDATSWHLLGVWAFTFADLPWYQKKIAATLFATPPASSYEEALEYFEKAESMDPGFYSQNLLMLGKTHLALGDKAKAKEFFRKTVALVVNSSDDVDAHDEAEKLLKE